MTVYQILHELQITLAVILGACPPCSQPLTLDRLAAIRQSTISAAPGKAGRRPRPFLGSARSCDIVVLIAFPADSQQIIRRYPLAGEIIYQKGNVKSRAI